MGREQQAAPSEGLATPTRAEFDAARGRIDGFVARHFSFRGALGLHRRALGGDLLRAPLNVFLAPLHALTRLAGFLCRLCGARRAADWLGARGFILTTRVAAEVEARLLEDLLALPASGRGAPMATRLEALAPEGLAEPDRSARAERAATTLQIYTGTRAAVAEMTTALLTVAFGAWMFHRLTPGMLSVAPNLANGFVQDAAIATFPLGSGLGALWYGAFPVAATGWQVAVTLVLLLALASVVTAFAGILADPLQARLGLHRARLNRLVDALERDLGGATPRPFAAREHFYARLLDLVDIGSGLFRHFR